MSQEGISQPIKEAGWKIGLKVLMAVVSFALGLYLLLTAFGFINSSSVDRNSLYKETTKTSGGTVISERYLTGNELNAEGAATAGVCLVPFILSSLLIFGAAIMRRPFPGNGISWSLEGGIVAVIISAWMNLDSAEVGIILSILCIGGFFLYHRRDK